MTVIQLPDRRARGHPSPALPLNRHASIRGSFRAPGGGAGTMVGSLRLSRLLVVANHVRAAGIFAGELWGPDGTLIGLASRRHTVPAAIEHGSHGVTAVLGPVDVDLLGLRVRIEAFDMRLGVARRL